MADFFGLDIVPNNTLTECEEVTFKWYGSEPPFDVYLREPGTLKTIKSWKALDERMINWRVDVPAHQAVYVEIYGKHSMLTHEPEFSQVQSGGTGCGSLHKRQNNTSDDWDSQVNSVPALSTTDSGDYSASSTTYPVEYLSPTDPPENLRSSHPTAISDVTDASKGVVDGVSSSDSAKHSSSGPNVGLIIGILGGVFGLIWLLGGGFLFLRARRRRREAEMERAALHVESVVIDEPKVEPFDRPAPDESVALLIPGKAGMGPSGSRSKGGPETSSAGTSYSSKADIAGMAGSAASSRSTLEPQVEISHASDAGVTLVREVVREELPPMYNPDWQQSGERR